VTLNVLVSAFTFSALFSVSACASSIVCIVEEEGVSPRSLAWNIADKTATMRTRDGERVSGQVTLITSGSSGPPYVNLVFPVSSAGAWETRLEFIVHEPLPDRVTVIGAAYRVAEGKEHLSGIRGPYKAVCEST